MPDPIADAQSALDRTAQLPSTAREALGHTPWLRFVSERTLDRLAEQAMLHRVPSGSVLFEQSEIPSFAQLLIGGCVELIAADGTNEALIETVNPIDLLLPAAVLTRQPYLARARVVGEAHLVVIHANGFRDAVTSDHALCLAVLSCQAAQFRRQVKLAKNLKLRSVETRVGCYLLNLLEGTDLHTPVRLPLEKQRIAWQLGMSRETFSRALAAMTRYGLRIEGDTIEVIDPEPLRAHVRLDPLIDSPEPILPLPSTSD